MWTPRSVLHQVVLHRTLGVTIVEPLGVQVMTRRFFSARAWPEPRAGKAAPPEETYARPRISCPAKPARRPRATSGGVSPEYVHDG
jgi:hypothetical protein